MASIVLADEINRHVVDGKRKRVDRLVECNLDVVNDITADLVRRVRRNPQASAVQQKSRLQMFKQKSTWTRSLLLGVLPVSCF